MLDRLDLAGEVTEGQPEHDRGAEVAPSGEMKGLVFGVDLAEHAPGLALRFRADARFLRAALGPHELALHLGLDLLFFRSGLLAHLFEAVGALLADQRLLAPRQLDLGGQLVLLDRPLFLDRQRPARERGLVCLLLHRFAGGRLQRLLHVRRGGHPQNHQADQCEAARLDFGVGTQGLLHGGLDDLRTGLHGFDHRHRLDVGAGRLLGALAPEARQALERLFQPDSRGERNGEAHPRRRLLRLGAAVAESELDVDLLEVQRQLVEDEGGLDVLDRHLGDRRRHGVEPVRQAGAATHQPAAPVVEDVLIGLGAQVGKERIPADLGHPCSPVGCWIDILKRSISENGGVRKGLGPHSPDPSLPALQPPGQGERGKGTLCHPSLRSG